MVIATNRPGFYEAQEAALTGAGGGMLLEDYLQQNSDAGYGFSERRQHQPGRLGGRAAWNSVDDRAGTAPAGEGRFRS